MRFSLPTLLVCCSVLAGCGTTKWTDTRRTATEQLLISDAMDRAVSRLDFRAVAGKTVYLDSSPLSGVTDSTYLISVLRQHMLASGCILKDARTEADYVVEVRAGAVGTDRRDVLFGMPQTQITGMLPISGVPASIPEMPLATKTEQRAVAKIALFAYNRKTGRPVWQSGGASVESRAKNVFVLGAGPFESGTIYDGMKFVGKKIEIPLISPGEKRNRLGLVSVADEAYFTEPEKQLLEQGLIAKKKEAPSAEGRSSASASESASSSGVIPASHTAPAGPATPSNLPQNSPESPKAAPAPASAEP
ncbi:MAG: hypothetical protein JXB62_03165 [Pirellulales bacterium]|nr:hypothetical protein [Pirellulales bacterium]